MSAPSFSGVIRVQSTTRSCFGSPEATPCRKPTAELRAAAGVAAPRPRSASALRRSIRILFAPPSERPAMTEPYHRSTTTDVQRSPARSPGTAVQEDPRAPLRDHLAHGGVRGRRLVPAAGG